MGQVAIGQQHPMIIICDKDIHSPALNTIPLLPQIWQEEEAVRGIMADKWEITTHDGYTLHYYFATDEWLMPYGKVMDGVNLKAPLKVTVS